MGLDKWIKSEGKEKSPKKEKTQKKVKKAVSTPKLKESRESSKILSKIILVCSKCKYQKTIMKKKLTEQDKICPRCNKPLKVKSK